MPKQVLIPKRSFTARIAVLAMVFSLVAVALPASAHSVAISTASSCPSTTPGAGFTDIGAFDSTTQTAINCLVMYGISTGTTATTYSPNAPVLRWQMALFLVRQAADHGLAVPAASNQGFTDIAGLPQATQDAINQVAAMEISRGTTTTTFSPNDVVSRWQMALFLHRLAGLAGVIVTDDPVHNEFGDIAGFSAETRTAINFLADGHIALGTGGSNFSPNDSVFRWSMALFLTRTLAADGVLPPAGLQVTVTPADAANLAVGNARAYTATFKNADGTPYTGAVGIGLFEVTGTPGVIQYDAVPVADAVFESQSDSLAVYLLNAYPTIEGFPGTDGVVTFLVRDTGAGTEVIAPVAWKDVNNDNDAEITGNSAPAETSGAGGFVTFTAGPLAECTAVTGTGAFAVTAVDKANDRFEMNGCSIFYDSNDVLLVDGVAASLADFEAALNVGDVVTGSPYAPASGDQSTLDISTDNDPALTITDPVVGGVTVDQANYTIKGTGVAGYTVAIYIDNVVNDGIKTAGEPKQAEGTVAVDGTWSLVVPLTQNAVNDFVATQRATPATVDTGTGVQVPLITESSSAAASLDDADGTNGGILNILDSGDTIILDFNETMNLDFTGDSLQVNDGPDTVTLTNGANASFAVGADNSIIVITVTVPLGVTINSPAAVQNLNGFVGTDGLAVNVNLDPDRTIDVPGF